MLRVKIEMKVTSVVDRIARTYSNKYPKKDNWEWRTNFSTKKLRYSDETTEEEVHRVLDEMFN